MVEMEHQPVPLAKHYERACTDLAKVENVAPACLTQMHARTLRYFSCTAAVEPFESISIYDILSLPYSCGSMPFC